MDKFTAAQTMASTVIQQILSENTGPLTGEMIQQAVDRVLPALPGWEVSFKKDQLIKHLQNMFAILIGRPVTIEDTKNHKPWLEARIGEIQWNYWNRYRLLLEQNGRGPNIVGEIDSTTNDILGRLEDPSRKDEWDRRGMVVGYVQSGKTANYIGLICKAADTGYSVIIVLAGVHNSLRSQTQLRLDEGFIGYDSKHHLDEGARPLVGVGLINPSLRPDTITTRMDNGDFSTNIAKQFHITPGGKPLLFVVKKNVTVLKNLLGWIRFASNTQMEDDRKVMSGFPLLMIDDEADLASIDVKRPDLLQDGTPDPDHDPTKINYYVRSILHSFNQSAYVGYTATPFANIFIWPQLVNDKCGEDLFPRSFITRLESPSDYVSPIRVFDIPEYEDSDEERDHGYLGDLLRRINDAGEIDAEDPTGGWMPPKHKRHHVPYFDGGKHVPPSLRKAILFFVLVIAARLERGHLKKHNSMLIHVTRFIDVQQEVWKQVSDEVQDIRNLIKLGSINGKNRIEEELRDIWENDFLTITRKLNLDDCPEVNWKDLKKNLIPVVETIKIKLFNGQAGDTLDYYDNRETGLNLIVIGGDKLSRGLTLEGLSVSYFLRTSRMYDTLLQMGRWFGYHQGYIDLCRLFMTNELVEWFSAIAAADEELRHDFEHMAATGRTPLEFGLKVRSHPKLLVTSQVKMRNGTKLLLSFTGAMISTTVFYKNINELKGNRDAVNDLINTMLCAGIAYERNPARNRGEASQRTASGICFSGVPSAYIIEFFNKYQTHTKAYEVKSNVIVDYIRTENRDGRLTDWTVFIPSGTGSEYCGYLTGPMKLIVRKWSKKYGNTYERQQLDRIVIKGIYSPADESIDLDNDAYSKALKDTVAAWEKEPGRIKDKPAEPFGRQIRAKRNNKKGLLILYSLDFMPFGIKSLIQEQVPVVGFVISFPGELGTEGVPYVVAKNFFQEFDEE